MSADALSDVLRTVRLTGAVFIDCAAREPWVVESPPRETILPRILPGADCLIAYHVVTAGTCWAGLIGQAPVELAAGDIIVFTAGDAHVLASRPGMRGPDAARAPDPEEQLPLYVDYGPDGEPTATFVCGYLACDVRPFNPLLANLPPVIVARNGDGASGNGWLAQFIRLAVEESAGRRPGGETVLAKLSELMFVEVLRRYLAGLPAASTGWLAGLRDPLIGKALSLLHAAPERDWTIESLARAAGQSRSVLAERFTTVVGMPAMHYLAAWRMQRAAQMLRTGSDKVATVARAVGYESEAAFSRAFRKAVGVPPAAWRAQEAAAGKQVDVEASLRAARTVSPAARVAALSG
jgi:AraC-like DNA-binding protein